MLEAKYAKVESLLQNEKATRNASFKSLKVSCLKHRQITIQPKVSIKIDVDPKIYPGEGETCEENYLEMISYLKYLMD